MLPLPATAERPRRARAVDLGMDRGHVPAAIAQHLADLGQAAAGAQHLGRRRVPQTMRAHRRQPPLASPAHDLRDSAWRQAGKGARRRSDFPHRDASLDGGHLVIDGEERVRCGNAGPKAAGRRGYGSPHDCGRRIAVAAGIPDRTSSESALLVAAGQRSPSRLRRALLQRTAVRSSGPNSPGAGEPVPGARSSSEPAHHKRWTLMLPRSASRSYRCRSRRSSRASRPRSAA